MSHQTFFDLEVPALLKKLEANTENLWGEMSATQMMDHLLAGTHLFMSKQLVDLEVPEEKIERYKAFLMSDKNFMESAPKPKPYKHYELKSGEDMEKLKASFLEALRQFDVLTKTDPDFWCFHPSFGKLNAEETRQLQFKHIRHHFQQFGLLPRE